MHNMFRRALNYLLGRRVAATQPSQETKEPADGYSQAGLEPAGKRQKLRQVSNDHGLFEAQLSLAKESPVEEQPAEK